MESAQEQHNPFSMKQAKPQKLSLQHQVTLAISHSHLDEVDENFDEVNAHADDEDDDEGFKETICDIDMNEEEEEEDIDIYTNVGAKKNLSIGSTLQGIAQMTLPQKTMSFSPNPNVFGQSFDMNADDENSMYGEDNISIMSPGAIDHEIYKKPTLRTEGANAYNLIEQCLKLCDNIDWEEHLQNFKDNKVCDKRVRGLSAHDWKELLPAIGVRNEFIELWNKLENRMGQ